MIFLHFRIGADSFALAADRIVEIVPLVELKTTRGAPDGLAGSFEYRGRFITVADLCMIELGRPARKRLSTRIIVVRHPEDETVLFGLIAEQATQVLTLDPAAFAPFAAGPHGLIQRVEIANLLPAALLSCMLGERLPG
jgi:chemotaxis-related protein WspB